MERVDLRESRVVVDVVVEREHPLIHDISRGKEKST